MGRRRRGGRAGRDVDEIVGAGGGTHARPHPVRCGGGGAGAVGPAHEDVGQYRAMSPQARASHLRHAELAGLSSGVERRRRADRARRGGTHRARSVDLRLAGPEAGFHRHRPRVSPHRLRQVPRDHEDQDRLPQRPQHLHGRHHVLRRKPHRLSPSLPQDHARHRQQERRQGHPAGIDRQGRRMVPLQHRLAVQEIGRRSHRCRRQRVLPR
mmetsp:Transcript_3971/g.10056  ORF Transcript_3971/g.10056 Transcript_3971/m.10056 type:complete len:211 (-) Transcript_3971:330-962(-)